MISTLIHIPLYYILQFVAWSMMILHQIIILLVLQKYNNIRTIIIIFSVLVAFLLTHTYRYIFHKNTIWQRSIQSQLIFASFFGVLFAIITGVPSYSLSVFFITQVMIWYDLRILSIIANWFLIYSIWLATFHLYHFFEALQKQKKTAWSKQQQLQETQSEVLKMQLNPHFIFNVLNSIRSLLIFDSQRAQQGINVLKELFFEGYSKIGLELITIADEMHIVKKYLTLEHLRFGDKLSFQYQTDENVLLHKIPAGSILTLVENAVKHGIKSFGENHIHLNIYTTDQYLYIKVSNQGIMEDSNTQKEASGIGLRNLHQRLALYFKNKAHFGLQPSISENIVDATIQIPIGSLIL